MRTGEPSTTARLVAAARLRAARLAGPGRPDDDERLARDVAGPLVHRTKMLQRHLEARTAFVDRVVQRALDDRVTQVILAAAGCDPAARSLVVAEGVAVYLEPAVLERLVTELARATGPGSRLALTASTMSTAPGAARRRERLRVAVASLGEPMLSSLTVDDADALLRRAGWSLLDAGAPAHGFLVAERRP